MVNWARLNEADEIVEIRDLPEEGEYAPVDIEHKGVRWRRVIDKPLEDHDLNVEDVCTNHEVIDDEVHCVHRAVPKDINDLRQRVLNFLRHWFGQQILDGMPNMKVVEAICATREATISRAMKINDYDQLKALMDVER